MSAALSLPLEAVFSAANTAALLSWFALVALPRWWLLRRAIQVGAVLGLCLAYTVLIQVFFFVVPGGGFFSLPAVQQLFTSREVALAGWIHYLAFDLFVGLWIAKRADELGASRWLQAPILVTTFMFGPVGLLMMSLLMFSRRWLSKLMTRRREAME